MICSKSYEKPYIGEKKSVTTISLMESDVAQEVIDYFEKTLRLDKTLKPQKIIKEIFDKAEKIDLIDRIKRHYGQGPFVLYQQRVNALRWFVTSYEPLLMEMS